MSIRFSHGYALLIGVGQTEHIAWSLPATVKDAEALNAILTNPDLCAYPDDNQHIRLLHDESATGGAIQDGLTWLKARAGADPEATAIVYYSGHGWLDHTTGRYYLIPHNTLPSDIPGSALPAEEFTRALRQIPARRLLVMLDCCHAAGMATIKETKAGEVIPQIPSGFASVPVPKALVENLKQGEGRAVFTSCLGRQKSWMLLDRAMSLYTYHLLEALQGAGNKPGDTIVHLSNLMNHLGRAVPASAKRLCFVEQTPFFDTATEDFPVALLRGGKGLSAGGWEAIEPEARLIITQTVKRIEQNATVIGIEANRIVGGEVKQDVNVVAGNLTGAKFDNGTLTDNG